jgi:hypothetical protein
MLRGTFRNQRINQSAVAAMTGLTRVQIRQVIKKSERAPRTRRSRVRNVIDGWTTDPAYATSSQSPRRLRISGKMSQFESLVRKYGGDIPARSILREMLRNGYVTVDSGYASLRSAARRSRAQSRLKQVAQALATFLKSPSKSAAPSYPLAYINQEISYPATSAKGRILMQKRTAASLDAFLADIQAAGSAVAVESPSTNSKSSLLTRTRILLITEDFEA